MSHRNVRFLAGAALALLLGAASVSLLNASTTSAQSGVPQGSTTTFAVLAASAVTSSGLTVLNGDLGVSPGTAITGFPPGVVTGAIHAANPVSAQAQADARVEYNYLDALPCDPANNLTGEDLGGRTLTPGVYCFDSSAQLTGTLILDAQGSCDSLFVFQTGSTLVTSVASSVEVINNPCAINCRGGANVFWQVGSSATIGVGSQFVGHIVANTSVTLNAGASVAGNVIALTGAVTLDTNNVSACGVNIPPTPTPTPDPNATPTPTPDPTPDPTITCAPKVTGGGQIPVPDPDSTNRFLLGTGRATFGFNSHPEKNCTDGGAKGHFNYVNHVSGLHVNGKVLNSQLIAPNTVRFTGECGAGCTFTVTVQDNGEPGTFDTFGLDVTGTKNEHRSLRVISRGNIQFHF